MLPLIGIIHLVTGINDTAINLFFINSGLILLAYRFRVSGIKFFIFNTIIISLLLLGKCKHKCHFIILIYFFLINKLDLTENYALLIIFNAVSLKILTTAIPSVFRHCFTLGEFTIVSECLISFIFLIINFVFSLFGFNNITLANFDYLTITEKFSMVFS